MVLARTPFGHKKNSIFLEAFLLQTHSIPMYANMNKPEQGITQIFAFIKIIKKKFPGLQCPHPQNNTY